MAEPVDRISVMIVDDHEMVRKGACSYLDTQTDMTVVAQAGSGEEAIRLAQEFIPDVVLMDLVMPGLDGVDTTRKIKNISPRTQIIILTSFHQDEYIFPALQAGAISYLLKDVKASDLVEAIRRAARGEATLHPRIAARVIKTFHSLDAGELTPFTSLTDREMEVLKLIAKGYQNEKIADQLVISLGTVKGHVSNILSKLHLVDRTQAAAFAWQAGIVRRE
jgi:two-component system, NarL family, response regulator LiaR